MKQKYVKIPQIKSSLFILLVFSLLTINKGHAQDSIHEVALSFFATLPETMPGSEDDTQAQIKLGKKLYFDTQLSINNSQSCNTCHNIINNAPGVDHQKVSMGALGEMGTRNSPSTWNAGLQVAQFWDGRAKTLEQQASFPIFNPKEMAIPSKQALIQRLTDNGYLDEFKQAFPDHIEPIIIENISKSLAAFQRTLISKDRFDAYLAGNKAAINQQEKIGLSVFIEKGCVACHNGPLLGGQLFMKMGLVHPYPNKIDRGLAHITNNSGDNYFFKVPSLRNVINTAPYFHDGAGITIEQAIKDTGWHQLGIKLRNQEVLAIKAFFNTLNNQAKLSF
ncbi:cytochrome-c peroxidase [sulfur-oxidizing endosymbiont of Gigantopelta aegis]|uniref:cytochrome-c peroxidase n=1 Tax=sulfur-oxidizing endosymbiont of Gigantopelta aegis TaxID=2794934 RepID=UPI0018DE34FF|nr:cytochrome c peroxidase [sulfur-oxidizing endosymbiont of Gigantopelta aegis]